MKTRYLNSRVYRKIMLQYLRCHDWGYELTITKVVVINRDGKVVVKIECYRPGLLIGKAGHFIDGLEKRFIEEIGKDVSIEVKECEIWSNLYPQIK